MSTPTVRKLITGRALRSLRDAAGMTQKDAAKAVAGQQSKVGEQESGERTVSHEDMARYLDAYGVVDPAVRESMLELTHGVTQRGRWSGHRSIHPLEFRPYLDLEECADQLRIVGSELVPGLVQHPQYVRELHVPAEAQADASAGTSADDAVAARLARQKIIQDGTPVHLVLSESMLRRTHGVSDGAMRAQLAYLLELSRLPNVDVQVLHNRARTASPQLVASRFILLRIPAPALVDPLEVAFAEGPREFRYLDTPEAVEAHTDLFQRLSTEALGAEDTRALLRAVMIEFSP